MRIRTNKLTCTGGKELYDFSMRIEEDEDEDEETVKSNRKRRNGY